MDGIGDFPRHRLAPAAGEVQVGDGVEQQAGLRMLRLAEEIALGGHLAQTAQVHDPHMIRNVMDYRQVVTDE